MIIVDAHLDLAYNVGRGRDVRQPAAMQPVADNEIATVGLPDLRTGGVGLICATIFCPPARYGKAGYTTAEEAWAIAREQIEWYHRQVEAGEMQMVRAAAELPREGESLGHAVKFILLLEGGDAVREGGDVARLYEMGVRAIGLAWRKGRMAGGTGFPGPITAEGRVVVEEMDKLGMIHDASHLAEEAFWQLMESTRGPVMASHSNCRAIVPTDRQLSDEMIRALVNRGSVIGINFYDQFLMRPEEYGKRRATLEDVLAHVRRICDLAGSARHVAIGTDLDGGLGRQEIPQELQTIADLPKVGNSLSAAGFSDDDVARIMGRNWLEFFAAHLPAAS